MSSEEKLLEGQVEVSDEEVVRALEEKQEDSLAANFGDKAREFNDVMNSSPVPLQVPWQFAVLTYRAIGNEPSISDVSTVEGAMEEIAESYPAEGGMSSEEYANKVAFEALKTAEVIENSPGGSIKDRAYFGARVNDDLSWLLGRPGFLAAGLGLASNPPEEVDLDGAYTSLAPQDWENDAVVDFLGEASNTLNYEILDLGMQQVDEVSVVTAASVPLGLYVANRAFYGANNYSNKVGKLIGDSDEKADVYRGLAQKLSETDDVMEILPGEINMSRRNPLLLDHIHRVYDEKEDEYVRKDPENRGTFRLAGQALMNGGKRAYNLFKG